MKTVYKLTTKVVFPEGAAPGAGGNSSNTQMVTRNGEGSPLLRGTALAGVLRSAYADKSGVSTMDTVVSKWFGAPRDGDFDQDSIIKIADAVVSCNAVLERTHNMVNRHTGAVAEKALFSLETIPPMADAVLSITLTSDAEETRQSMDFLSDLSAILGNGLLIGGNRNRGIGRMNVEGNIYLRTYNLESLNGAADFLDAEYEEKKNGAVLQGDILKFSRHSDNLTISLELGIPRGEDLLVGDGQETDYNLQPQAVFFHDGTKHWRIPGASLRGIIRNWMTRLAVRDGATVRDSVKRWYDQEENKELEIYNPELIGWGFIKPDDRKKYQKTPDDLNDPILDLFGSMYKKSRIHITDAFSGEAKDTDIQDRMHVAVDRFSGGAHEGALFQNQVLVGQSRIFSLSIFLEAPEKQEIEWLVKTLRALHLGILHVGSSKGCGRLEIKSISATGCEAEAITTFAREV